MKKSPAVFLYKYVLIVPQYSKYDCFFSYFTISLTVSEPKLNSTTSSPHENEENFLNIGFELYEIFFGFSSQLCG
jgi:hypothetical protein